MPANWPSLAEVQTRLSEAGITAPSAATITSAINAAIASWEKMTNYEPFLGTGNDETRYLTGEGCLIDFQGGLTDEPTSLTINGNYTSAGAYENGTALVVNRDYTLLPHNAITRGKPYTHCKLHRYHTFVEWAGIKIVAPFGYAETVPADVWEAIMSCVLSILTPRNMISVTGGQRSWKEADVEEVYGGGDVFTRATDYFRDYCREIVALYRRIIVT